MTSPYPSRSQPVGTHGLALATAAGHGGGSGGHRGSRSRGGSRAAGVLALVVALAGLAAPRAARAQASEARTTPAEVVRQLVPQVPVAGWKARRAAARDFRAYLERNPRVAAIFREEVERETVGVATRNIFLSLGTAAAVIATAIVVDVWTAAPALIALVQSWNQVENRGSKLMKARGTTLTKAAAAARKRPEVEAPDVPRYLAAGFVRKGDIGKLKKPRAERRSARPDGGRLGGRRR